MADPEGLSELANLSVSEGREIVPDLLISPAKLQLWDLPDLLISL